MAGRGLALEAADWRIDYKEVRLRSRLGRMPLARFAEVHRQRSGDAAQSPSTQPSIEEPSTPGFLLSIAMSKGAVRHITYKHFSLRGGKKRRRGLGVLTFRDKGCKVVRT